MTLKPLGLILTATALAAPLYWMAPLAVDRDVVALFSQYLGIVALIAMAITQLIATRLPFVEPVFGGLDRAYILHKWLGVTAMVAILLHDTIDADMDGLGRETILVDIAETVGELGLYGFLILVVISVATFVPYHLWYWTHKIMGTLFAMSTFHFLFILKPFDNTDTLGLYVTAMCLLGISAYIYTLAPRWLRAKRRYTVSDIRQDHRNTVLTLTPIGRPMRYRAGQFAFVRFDQSELNEPHPFTISKAPDESGVLRFTIARLGDFTSGNLRHLEIGVQARIEGPYGRFTRNGNGPEIWIAAGVGITPFIAWAQALDTVTHPVVLFYCVGNESAASHLAELRDIEGRHDNFRVVLHQSQDLGRLTPDEIVTKSGMDIVQTQVYFCGPQAMRDVLQKGLSRQGLNLRRFHYEEFEIRTGIGLVGLAQWVLVRAATKIRKRI